MDHVILCNREVLRVHRTPSHLISSRPYKSPTAGTEALFYLHSVNEHPRGFGDLLGVAVDLVRKK